MKKVNAWCKVVLGIILVARRLKDLNMKKIIVLFVLLGCRQFSHKN
jgi:hypothetical protein